MTWVLTVGLIVGTIAVFWPAACAALPDNPGSNANATAVERTAVGDEIQPVTGRVVDRQGKPIGEAFVCLAVSRSNEITWEGPTVLAATESGAGGQFYLAPLKSELQKYAASRRNSLEIWVHKPGWSVGMQQSLGVPPDKPMEIRLDPETTIEIALRDAQGISCAGATVTPNSMDFDHDPWLGVPQPIRPRLETSCDASGKALLKGLRLEQVRNLTISHPAYGSQVYYSRKGLPIATDLTLLPTGSIRGKLIVPDGGKFDLTKVRVRVATLDPKRNDPDESWTGTALIQPDEQGNFSVPHIAAGTVRVTLTTPDDFPLRADPSHDEPIVPAGATVELLIPMRRVIPVRQLVRDADSKQPLKNVYVSLQHYHLTAHARTDKEGFINMMLLPGAPYNRYVEVPEGYLYPNLDPTVTIPMGVDKHTFPPVELRLGRAVEGVVLDAAGRPFPGVSVKAIWAKPDDSNAVPANSGPGKIAYGKTGADGRFVITRIDQHFDLTLSALRAGVNLGGDLRVGANDKRELIIKTKPFDFTSLNGRVMDTAGLPVEGAKVYIATRNQGQISSVCRIYSGSDGVFQAPPHLVKGQDYRITISSNKLDVESEWYPLQQANLKLPDIVVDRKKMEIRSYIQRP